MLASLWKRLRTDSPRWAQRLGLTREHFAIASRHARVRAAWAPHLRASREAILAATERCARRERALVIGAGDCLDVPVAELAERFAQVTLADIVVSATAKDWARRLTGRVRCERWDATGALVRLAEVRDVIAAVDAPKLFATADPGPPPGGEPDFVVSANCLSQLGLVPAHSLPAAEKDKGLPERCAKVAARRHLDWLAERRGAVRVLLVDAARLDLAPDGVTVRKTDTLYTRFGLRPPDRTWRWNLAPIPEWSPDFHRVHDVGVWIDGP
ncbi:hypothetical protein [Oleiharenicola sp. Vm1]|uniref:hypothetical protein n=1 Tax=Oleiharenicola sp. Vm1 TaxID=3398393 RepID=UPI0039F5C31E